MPSFPTLHVVSANSPRCVAFSSTLTFPFQFSIFNFILCSVCRYVMPSWHFLNSPWQNAPFQPLDSQRPFKISPFPAFGGSKCHNNEETPPERAPLRKLLTKTKFSHTEKQKGRLRRSEEWRVKSEKSKLLPSPLGEGEVLPFRGGFRRGFGGVRGGVIMVAFGEVKSEEWRVKNQSYYPPPRSPSPSGV